jgi:hypothetical protein
MVDIRNPDIPIGPFICPFAVVVQFGLIFIQISRQIPGPRISVVEDIAAFVPFCERILVSCIDIIGT